MGTVADAMALLGVVSVIVGLFLIDLIVGLVGGGIVMIGAGLLLAKLNARSS